MARFIKDRSASKGQGPGSLILIGKQKMEQPVIQLMDIGSDTLEERELESVAEMAPYKESDSVSWINIWGIHDVQMIKELGEQFGVHSLLLEDLLDTDQRPKHEEGDTYNAFILKMLKFDEESKQISAEQCTLILGKHFIITLQEQKGDFFDPIRNRIRNTQKRTRFTDPDYLTYALLDSIVDQYIQVTEAIGRQIEALEDRLFDRSDQQIITDIHTLKKELSFLRKSVRPVRDLMLQVLKSDNEIFQEKYLHFIKDLNDLVLQATEAIELYNGMISDHLNIYSTLMNNRNNEVMKVLTIFASIFIPLTFLAGIYGMNFKYMPELSFRYSYLIFWIVAIVMVIILLIYFRRKRWL